MFYSTSFYNNGIYKIRFKPRRSMRMIVIPPGDFFARPRNLNEIDIAEDTLTYMHIEYSIHKSLEDPSKCNKNMDWSQDTCRLQKESCLQIITCNIIKTFFQFNKNIFDSFNCTAPWLLNFARTETKDIKICGNDTR